MNAQPQTIGAMIDQMCTLREERKTLERQAKDLGKVMSELEGLIIEKLDTEETSMSRGKSASASISEAVVPTVKDWDAFYGYIMKNNAPYMLQRRAATGPYRDLIDSGEEIPGVETFTKRSISLRKI